MNPAFYKIRIWVLILEVIRIPHLKTRTRSMTTKNHFAFSFRNFIAFGSISELKGNFRTAGAMFESIPGHGLWRSFWWLNRNTIVQQTAIQRRQTFVQFGERGIGAHFRLVLWLAGALKGRLAQHVHLDLVCVWSENMRSTLIWERSILSIMAVIVSKLAFKHMCKKVPTI